VLLLKRDLVEENDVYLKRTCGVLEERNVAGGNKM
jgi:hypothetical protein